MPLVSVVFLASAKGSPGVTTTALALTSWWPRPAVLLEADPAGGDLAARLGLPEEPGLVGLAASLRRDGPAGRPIEGWLEPFVQTTSAGIRLVPGPAGTAQATTAIELLAHMSTVPALDGANLLVDLGRLVSSGRSGRSSPLPSFRDGADGLIWFTRPQLADLAHLASAIDHGRDGGNKPSVVLVGAGPYPADEVADAVGPTILGHLPADPSGAAALWAGGGRTWAHSPLGRATKELALVLADSRSATTGGSASPGGTEDASTRSQGAAKYNLGRGVGRVAAAMTRRAG